MSRATRANVVVSQVIPDFTALTINTKNEATTTPQHPKHVARTAPQHHKLVFYDAEDIMMPGTKRGADDLTPDQLEVRPVPAKDPQTEEREKQMKIINYKERIYKNPHWVLYYPPPRNVNELNEDDDVDQLKWTVYDPAKDAKVSGKDRGNYWYIGKDKVHFLREGYPDERHDTQKEAILQFMVLYNETSLMHKVASGGELSQPDLDMLALKLQGVTQGKTCYGISLPPGFLPCVQVANDREPLTTPRKWDTFFYGPIWHEWNEYILNNAAETNAAETNAAETNAAETNAPETNAPIDIGRTVSMRKCKSRKLAWLIYTGLYRTCPELKKLQEALANQATPEQATSSQSAIVPAPVNHELPELCGEDERLAESTDCPHDGAGDKPHSQLQRLASLSTDDLEKELTKSPLQSVHQSDPPPNPSDDDPLALRSPSPATSEELRKLLNTSPGQPDPEQPSSPTPSEIVDDGLNNLPQPPSSDMMDLLAVLEPPPASPPR